LLDSFIASVLFVGLDSKVEWGQTFGVLSVKVTAPSDNVVEGEFGS